MVVWGPDDTWNLGIEERLALHGAVGVVNPEWGLVVVDEEFRARVIEDDLGRVCEVLRAQGSVGDKLEEGMGWG